MSTTAQRRSRRLLWAAIFIPAVAAGSSPASAQEFVHTFINPSFGGNPFYSEHLLGIANIDRPAEPEDPAAPAPTPEELLISQLQAQLNATISSNILRAIQTAQPGQSGEFLLGDQRVNFTRSTTATRVTFTNLRTGETREIVIPVSSTGLTGTAVASAESALGARGSTVPLIPSAPQSQPSPLLAPPPL